MNRFELLRYRAGLGASIAADKSGVAYRTILKLESGELALPKAPQAAKLAEVYGVSVDVILGLAPVPDPEPSR